MGKKVNVEEKVLLVDGIRTHITIAGSGTPLLLVHGLGGPLMWQRVVEPLSETFRVIAVDLPGFGDSDCPPKYFSTQEYAAFLFRLLEQLNVQKISIAGISYGGQIAAMFAGRYPERVEKMILIATPGLAWGKFLFQNSIFWMTFSAIGKHLLLRNRMLICFIGKLSFYRATSRPQDLCTNFFRQLSSTEKRETLLHTVRNIYTEQDQLRSCFKELRSPALILWGKNDRTVPVKFAYQFQRMIPDSAVTIFRECAHSVPLEKPVEFCNAIRSFIQQIQRTKEMI